MKAPEKRKIIKILKTILIITLYVVIDCYVLYRFRGLDLLEIVEIPSIGNDYYYKFPFWFVLVVNLVISPLLAYSIITIIPLEIMKMIQNIFSRK